MSQSPRLSFQKDLTLEIDCSQMFFLSYVKVDIIKQVLMEFSSKFQKVSPPDSRFY